MPPGFGARRGEACRRRVRAGLFACVQGVDRHPRLSVGLAVVATVVGLLVCLWTLRPGTRVADMLPGESPAAASFSEVIERYKLIDDLVVVLRDGDATAERAAALLPLLEATAGVEGVRSGLPGRPTEPAPDAGSPGGLAGGASVGGAGPAASGAWPAFIRRWGIGYLDDAAWSRLTRRLAPQEAAATLRRTASLVTRPGLPESARAAALADPFRLGPLLRPAGAATQSGERDRGVPLGPCDLGGRRAWVLRVAGLRPANELSFTQPFVARIRRALDGLGLTYGLAGSYAVADFSARATRRDMIVSLAASMVLLSLLFLWVYRSARVLPATLFTLHTAIVLAFAVYAWGGGPLTPVTAVAGAILAGLGVDYCIHLRAHLRRAGRRSAGHGLNRPDVLRVVRAAPSLGLACVTSGIGFAACAFAGVAALRQFALLGVLGLGLCLLLTLLLYPTVLSGLGRGRRGRRGRRDHAAGGLGSTRPPRGRAIVSHWVAGLVRRPRRPLFLASVAVGMLGMAWLQAPQRAPAFAVDLRAMHAEPNPPLALQEALAEASGGTFGGLMLRVRVDAPEALVPVSAAVAEAARGVSGVAAALGPADLVPDADVLAARRAEGAVLATHAAEAAAAGPFAPGVLDAAVAGLAEVLTGGSTVAETGGTHRRARAWGLGEVLDAAEQPAVVSLLPMLGLAPAVLPRGPGEPREGLVLVRLVRPWESTPDRAVLARRLERAAVRAAEEAAPGGGAAVTLTGLPAMGLEVQGLLASAVQRVGLLAGFTILGVLCLAFRQAYDVMLALVPVGTGLLALGAWVVLTGTELHAANLIAVPLTVGLGVDDGVFLLTVDRWARGARPDPAGYARRMSPTVHAVLMTSVTTTLAFGSMALTQTPAIRSLGVLSMVGIAGAVGGALVLLLPFLAMRRFPRRRGTGR